MKHTTGGDHLVILLNTCKCSVPQTPLLPFTEYFHHYSYSCVQSHTEAALQLCYRSNAMNHFFFPIRTVWMILCITAYFPSFSFTLWQLVNRHLLIVSLYRHRPHRPWGAGGGSEDPGSVQGIQKQEQPEPTLSLPRLHPCQSKTALLWNNLGQSIQQSPNTPKRIVKLCPYVGDCIVIYSISPYRVPLNTFYLYMTILFQKYHCSQ